MGCEGWKDCKVRLRGMAGGLRGLAGGLGWLQGGMGQLVVVWEGWKGWQVVWEVGCYSWNWQVGWHSWQAGWEGWPVVWEGWEGWHVV